MDFSFKYDGKKYYGKDLTFDKRNEDGTEIFSLGALRITRRLRDLGKGARHSLLWFENTGEENSGVISEILDIDHSFGLDCEELLPYSFCGYNSDITKIYYTSGSDWVKDEFESRWERINEWGNRYSNAGGRSSQGKAPFFEIRNERKNKGLLLAVGWTGQWFVKFNKNGTAVNAAAGIEDIAFYLLPGEKIRTASVLAVEYEGTRNDAHNRFRRIIKEYFTKNRGEKYTALLSMSAWGGAKSEFLKEQITKAAREKFGFEYYWIDAGWYGDYECYCPDAFNPAWAFCTGDWTVNKRVHGGGMRDVFKLAEENGMKPLLWLEPERAYKAAKILTEKPELFLTLEGKEYYILNLADEKAQKWMIDTVSYFVEDLNLKCYRQDFNTDPLEFWNKYDAKDRKGITQIKYITGLYKVWDTLLEKYPDLIIDNCASGGRRLDIETLSRSVALWRSDANCHTDFNPNWIQNHNIGLSYWLPYHGNGFGEFKDKYTVRSCHSTALVSSFFGDDAFKDSVYDPDEIRGYLEEYKSVREFYACDYYPVFGQPLDDTAWAGWQFHNPDTQEGIVAAFRRDQCLSESVTVLLEGLDDKKVYQFNNPDTGETFKAAGRELKTKGLKIEIKQKRDSRLFRYKIR